MKPILVFQTDFTYMEGAVAAMYGVVKSVDPTLEIIDATHLIPQYDIYSASYRLIQYMSFWPKGTIFVSVVDPGVGTKRKACVAKTKDGYYVVTPDNGTLTHLVKTVGIEEVREINEEINRLKRDDNKEVSIFHGRDLFGYCAARLASGIITYEEVGEKYDVNKIRLIELNEPKINNNNITGAIEIVDPNFGNAWSNVTLTMFKQLFNYGDLVKVKITKSENILYEDEVKFVKAFGDVDKDTALLYNNEKGNIAVALSQNSFIKKYNVWYGNDYKIEFSNNKALYK